MSPARWIFFTLAILLGLGLGLLYGWVISPVEYVDTTLNTLRVDFRADYTLMVAESFQRDQNSELAARRLASLGSQPPAEIAAQALKFAQQYNYSANDIALLQNLTVALQVWQPGGVVPPVRNAAGMTPAVQPGGGPP